jgi:hypothetical protein
MNIKVLVEDTEDAKSVEKSPNVFFVEQANARAIVNIRFYGKVFGNRVKAFVPACSPTVSSQVPEADFKKLEECYYACVMEAAEQYGSKTVIVYPFGCGKKTNIILEKGKLVHYDVWGDLFWSHSKSSMAAKNAIERATQNLDDDVTAIFIVPKENFDDWDCAMRF